MAFEQSIPALPSVMAGVAVGTLPPLSPGAGTLSLHVPPQLSRGEFLCC